MIIGPLHTAVSGVLKHTVRAAFLASVFVASNALAGPFFFSTGNPNGLIATASRPAGGGAIEIESADDFILPTATTLTSATFTGLLPTGFSSSGVLQVVVEIYRVYPNDSNTVRTPNVPTRANSPSDVAFLARDSAAGTLSFSTSTLSANFSVANTVVNGIQPSPSQFTGGEGPATGMEVLFTINFTTPIDLAAGHYFFVPEVLLSSGGFLWLSAPLPITGGTGPFTGDLQSWIRNDNLDPDWLRIGTDITNQGPFNAAFSLTGAATTVPEPGTLALLGLGLAGLVASRRRMQ